METKADIRRKNLAKWFAHRSYPEKDKSYISQLINGVGSFGEKAARRLEREYGMDDGYLDRVEGAPLAAVPGSEATAPAGVPMDDIIELLALFEQATPTGRRVILNAARSAASLAHSHWKRVANHDG